MMGHLGPVDPGRVKPPACRQAGRGSRKGKGGHPPPLDKGGSDAWRACVADGAAAAGVVWNAPRPGLGHRVRMRVSGPRYYRPGYRNGGAGFRRRAPVCPPHIYINVRCHCGGPRNSVGKQQCHLETAGSDDGHWHLRAEVYRIVIYVPAPMSNVTIFRYVTGTDASGL